MKRYSMIMLLFAYSLNLIFISCRNGSNKSLSRTEKSDSVCVKNYNEVLSESVELFSSYSLPNTQALVINGNINQYLDSINERRKFISKIFYTNRGISYLDSVLRKEKDECAIICILTILRESDNDKAIEILKKFPTYNIAKENQDSGMGENVPSDMAKRFYKEMLAKKCNSPIQSE